jgi:hypothetical protein
MAIVIPFQQLVERRRRQQMRSIHLECVRILECNHALAERMCEAGSEAERQVWQRRRQVLGALLEYTKQYP